MLFALLAITTSNYFPTPEAAAVQIVSVGVKKPAIVRRVNIVGRYASVLTSGGRMEGWSVTEPILLERFSFGWQALDMLSPCVLESHGFDERVDAMLMRGMPKQHDDGPCKETKDAGPPSQVEAVRRLMRGPLVPTVVVSGDWAMGYWYGAGGGEALFRRHDGEWHLVTGGGGVMGVSDIRAYGVPESDWCKFGIYDAKCH